MAAKFDLKKTSDAQYHFVLKAANGEVILSSETYTTKQSAKNGIDSVRANAPYDSRYEKRTSGQPTSQRYYFVLKAANSEVIGTSEMYATEQGRDNGIKSVKTNAPGAPVDDNTGE